MRVAVVVLAALLCAGSSGAQHKGFGLGIIAGEPTGICGKLWVGHRAAFAGAAAWSFTDDAAVHLHGDALIHSYDFFGDRYPDWPVYYGLGARVKFAEGDSWLGLRIPLGLAYLFEDAPLDVFLEVAPLMDLLPKTEFRVNGAIGIRYFFGDRSSGGRGRRSVDDGDM